MKKSKNELEDLYHLWFDTKTSELLKGWPVEERDEKYYVNEFYEYIICNLNLPKHGKILVTYLEYISLYSITSEAILSNSIIGIPLLLINLNIVLSKPLVAKLEIYNSGL